MCAQIAPNEIPALREAATLMSSRFVLVIVPGKAGGDEDDQICISNRIVDCRLRDRLSNVVGLVPFVLAHANDGFGDYSLIPVFPDWTFRHKSIFMHNERGITRQQYTIHDISLICPSVKSNQHQQDWSHHES